MRLVVIRKKSGLGGILLLDDERKKAEGRLSEGGVDEPYEIIRDLVSQGEHRIERFKEGSTFVESVRRGEAGFVLAVLSQLRPPLSVLVDADVVSARQWPVPADLTEHLWRAFDGDEDKIPRHQGVA